MADSDLLFQQTPGGPDLVFGEVGAPPSGNTEITLYAVLPALTAAINVAPITQATLAGVLPELTASFDVVYQSRAQRPTVGTAASAWQGAVANRHEASSQQQQAQKLPVYTDAPHEQAQPLDASVLVDMTNTLVAVREQRAVPHQEAIRLPTATRRSGYQAMIRDRRPSRVTGFQQGVRVSQAVGSQYEEMLRDRRPSRESSFQAATRSGRLLNHRSGNGRRTTVQRDIPFQYAMRPPAGMWVLPPIPGPDPCYVPSSHLVFDGAWPADGHLVFICEKSSVTPPAATVVVPTRRVYFVLNTVQVTRISGNLDLSALTQQVALTIDVDSWVWSFSATMDLRAEDDVQPSGGVPVELEIEINGSPYRVIVEGISRERTFGQTSLRVAGRGKAALLAAPYSPLVSVVPTIDRSAQQLVEDVLTDNGYPLGWTLDWNITDWLVPAGAWTHNGTYIDGVLNIANAVGAYVQPHPTTDSLSILPRYPDMPWEWGTVTPDFELPVAVVTREGIEWQTKPDYNRVFVSGTTHGYAGQVTRFGTAGDLAAGSISDPLMTEEAAIRQRARAVLGDTGRKALVNLRLPVLNATGIITPGKYVRYLDGSVSRVGLVRSTSIDAGLPEVWQTIGVETQV